MKNNDFVISSRVRIARNVEGYPFPNKLSENKSSEIALSAYDAINKDKSYEFKSIANMSDSEIGRAKERNLISSYLSQSAFGSLILKKDESVAVMVNELDHIVITATEQGLNLEKAYKVAEQIETDLESKFKYAYSDKLGYLTSSPSLVGTALKVSVKMFLPALNLTSSVSEVSSALSRINISLKATANDETSNGYIYEISSLHTLGVSEKDIIDKVTNAVNSVANYEEKAREKLFRENQVDLKDKIMRSYGIATNCYKMSSSEMLSTLAFVRLGAYYKVLPIADVSVIDTLCLSLMPYSISDFKKTGFINNDERNIFRASKISQTLKSL